MANTSKAPIRAAVVGLGMGMHHIPHFRRHPRCQVVAVCDADPARLKSAARDLGIERGYARYQDLLEAGGFDVVSIALPNDLHAPVTVAFIEAGYHVLAEKPLARDAREGARIVEAAKRAGVRCAIHMNQRMSPEHQWLRRAFDAGDFGDIHYIRTGWMRRRGIPIGAASWFVQKVRAGGGPLIDLGVHMIDSALYICGFPDVVAVSGQTHRGAGAAVAGMDVEDFATARLRCANGTVIAVEVSWASHHDDANEAFMHIYGSKGGAHRSTHFDLDWKATTTLSFCAERHGALLREEVIEMPADILSVQEDLVQAIIDDREPLCTLEEAHAVMKVLDAVYESAQSGREVLLLSAASSSSAAAPPAVAAEAVRTT